MRAAWVSPAPCRQRVDRSTISPACSGRGRLGWDASTCHGRLDKVAFLWNTVDGDPLRSAFLGNEARPIQADPLTCSTLLVSKNAALLRRSLPIPSRFDFGIMDMHPFSSVWASSARYTVTSGSRSSVAQRSCRDCSNCCHNCGHNEGNPRDVPRSRRYYLRYQRTQVLPDPAPTHLVPPHRLLPAHRLADAHRTVDRGGHPGPVRPLGHAPEFQVIHRADP